MSKQYRGIRWVKEKYGIKSHSTIYAWVDEGFLPAPVKLGKRLVRWPEDELPEPTSLPATPKEV